jgi:hypothetical protein
VPGHLIAQRQQINMLTAAFGNALQGLAQGLVQTNEQRDGALQQAQGKVGHDGLSWRMPACSVLA